MYADTQQSARPTVRPIPYFVIAKKTYISSLNRYLEILEFKTLEKILCI